MSITTHVLDTSLGRPAQGVEVLLERQSADGSWAAAGWGSTDADGRIRALIASASTLQAGTYRLTFHTAAYFAGRSVTTFYPRVVVEFHVSDAGAHYHVPLLVSPYGYSTYRGS